MAGKRKALVASSIVAILVILLAVPSAQTAPGDAADLAVTKTDSPDPVLVDTNLTYTIQVSNGGPDSATSVTVSDRLPQHVDFLSATSTSGACTHQGNRVECQIASLGDDPTKANAVTVTIVVRPTKAGTIVNTVTVDSPETDPVAANDKAEATTTVIPPPRASSCRGVTATIVGTPGAERLVGTGGPDVIAGLRGGDEIISRSGRDLVCAGGGNDRVVSGPARDRVFGGTGADRLLGRGGPDLLAGNPGGDLLKGGAGSDQLRGGRGFDRCVGGAGFDRVRSCER
jgi:uncharacterized repeat protein (TIGR01451 family)